MRLRLREPVSALTHLLGAVLSVIGMVMLIVLNTAKEPRTFVVRANERTFRYTLPAASVVTFTWS